MELFRDARRAEKVQRLHGVLQVLAELTRFAPEIVRGCRESLEKAVSDLDFLRLDHDAFAACPEDSIDYAVMERTDRGVMVPLFCDWSDLGS